MAYYLDSSAVVKYYVTEPGSAWLREQLAGQQAVFLSEITTVEVAAALGILQRIGRVRPSRRRRFWEEFEQDCTVRYDLVPVVHETIQAASKLCAKYPLRAYDAVQLATALR